MSYRVQILHGSSYGQSEQNTKVQKVQKKTLWGQLLVQKKKNKVKQQKYKTEKYKNQKTQNMQIDAKNAKM